MRELGEDVSRLAWMVLSLACNYYEVIVTTVDIYLPPRDDDQQNLVSQEPASSPMHAKSYGLEDQHSRNLHW